MVFIVVEFASMLFAALLAGAMFCVALIFNPKGLDATTYITLQQQAIQTLNSALPALGAATILVTIAASVLGREDRGRLILLIAAVFLFLAAGLITRFLNQPINAIVMTWRSDAPPSNWTTLRDEWWRWHLIRFLAGTVGLGLVLAAALTRDFAG